MEQNHWGRREKSGASLLGRSGWSRGHPLLRSSCGALAPRGRGEGTGVLECHVGRHLEPKGYASAREPRGDGNRAG